MDQTESSSIVLLSSDLRQLIMDKKSAKLSKFIKNFIEDFPNEVIHFQEIDYDTLLQIKEYLDYHKDNKPKKIPKPLPNKDFKEIIEEWDYNYIDKDSTVIFKIMEAANFMDIKPLLNLTCAKISSLIKGKNPDEIRRTLGMEDDIDELDDKEEENGNKDEFLVD